MIIIAFFIAHWYLSLFFQTFFMHRYAAHGMFTMSRAWEKVFFVLSWIFMGSNYLSPYGYGVMHRMHHAYADTEDDPHSPSYDPDVFSMMWRTKTIYSKITNGEYVPEHKFIKNVPAWHEFDTFARSWISRIAWGGLYVLFYYQFATAWWQWIFLPMQFALAPIHGAIINWFAHKYGYINYEVSDTSKNLLPFDFLMMGESYHNNHHKFGSRANFGGIRWHEIDPTYVVIKLLDKVGIIHLKNTRELQLEEIKKAA